jgi:hypothetical protein
MVLTALAMMVFWFVSAMMNKIFLTTRRTCCTIRISNFDEIIDNIYFHRGKIVKFSG